MAYQLHLSRRQANRTKGPFKERIMEHDIRETRTVIENPNNGHKTAITLLAVGLAVALAGDGYLAVRANRLNLSTEHRRG